LSIQLLNISKRFRNEWIFRNVSLDLKIGSCTAVIGSNGSGKSTILQIISGYLSPSEGEIRWNLHGQSISRELIFQHVAWCTPAMQLWDELTLRENIALFLQFKKLPWAAGEKEFARLIQLENQLDRTLKTFSSGMKQRVKLGLAILSDASIVLLDEPCSHLDADGVAWYQALLDNHLENRMVMIASNRDERETFRCSLTLDINDFKR
jgi:ABC-2 type transport system ATP-binding protein